MKITVFAICRLLVMTAVPIVLVGCATPQYYILPDDSPAPPAVPMNLLELDLAPEPAPEPVIAPEPADAFVVHAIPQLQAPAPVQPVPKASPPPAKKKGGNDKKGKKSKKDAASS